MSSTGWWREPSEMDEAQQRIVALPPNGRYLITGKPGSGKTNLLVLRAAYLIRAGHEDLRVLTWGRLIIEFIASGSARHGLDNTQLTTFKTWASEALLEAGQRIDDAPTDFEELIEYLIERLETASEADELPLCDGVLLDEVQDYPLRAVRLLVGASQRLFLAGDENQRIYGQDATLRDLDEYVDERIALPYHYRNGLRICRVAEAIKGEDDYVATSRYDEDMLPSRVSIVRCPSIEDQVEALKHELRSQLRSYPNELLGVMVPLRDDLGLVVEILREDEDLEPFCQFQSRAEGNEPLSGSKPIIVSTIHAAKGLEYRAAHIIAMEGISRFPQRKRRNMAYTAVTRAKTTLIGYYTGSAESWLRSAFGRGQDPPPTPTLNDIPW